MAEKQKRFAIIVAGGSGSRMNSALPKQFMLVNGKPILQITLEKFFNVNAEIILVLPALHIAKWKELQQTFSITIPHFITTGGDTRSESVFNGLKCINNDNVLVAIHDAVRCTLSVNLINKLFEVAEQKGNSIPVIPLNDSIRKVNDEKNSAANRNEFRIVQTPQVFNCAQLKNAFKNTVDKSYTDEASLMEANGYTIYLADGEQENFKITFPTDIFLAESLLKK